MTKSVISNLQICRALAALIVVIGHSLHDLDTLAARAGVEPVTSTINWGAGIDIFFVVSGFIMVYVAGQDFGEPGAPRRFLAKRFARVAPLYWLVTTALIVGSFIAPSLLNEPIGGVRHILTSYLFIPDLRPDMTLVRPVMALGWTLNYEMLFYVVFACAMALPLRFGLAAMTALLAGAALAKTLLGVEQTQLAFWMDPLVLEFLFGVYLGLAHRAGWRLSAPVAIALGLAGLALVTTRLPEAAGLTISANFLRYGVPATMLVGAAALGPQAPALGLGGFAIALGDASYALYLSHPFVIRPLREIWLKIGGADFPLVLYVVVCTIGAVAVAFALHIYLERPIARLLGGARPRRVVLAQEAAAVSGGAAKTGRPVRPPTADAA
jgi:peptidoglycan/LPS O-acetylase OafA/YrhL